MRPFWLLLYGHTCFILPFNKATNYMKSILRLPSKIAIFAFQGITAIFLRPILRCFGGWEIRLKISPVHWRKRYIIIGNHQSMLDPFVIFAIMPFWRRLPFLPIKFMTIPKVYHRWYVKPLAFLLGCFPAHIRERNHHTYGVEGSVKLLSYGYNICMFPEGRRTTQKESDPKPGIVQILQKYPEATLLLAHIQWTRSGKFRRHITITITSAPKTLDKTDPKALMDAIYAL